MRAIRLLFVAGGIVSAAACNPSSSPEIAGTNPPSGSSSGCRAIALAAPNLVTLSVGQSVDIAMTVESGCPAPLLRNDTPTILQVDSLAIGFARVSGRSPGAGRLTVRSGVDTLVTASVLITVTR